MGHGQKSLQNTLLAHSNYSLLKTTIALIEHLSLFHYRLISKCITYMPMPPISKEITSSQTTSYTYIFVYSPNDTRYIQVLKKKKKKKYWISSSVYYWPKKQSVCGILSPQEHPSFDRSRIIPCIVRHRGEHTVIDITLTWDMSLTLTSSMITACHKFFTF